MGGKVKSYDEAKELLKDAHCWGTHTERPPYKRPAILNGKQCEIIDAICTGTWKGKKIKAILIEGDRHTGKTTAAWVGIGERNYSNDRGIGVDIWASKGDACTRLLSEAKNDALTFAATDPLIIGSTAKRIDYFNGGVIYAHDTTVKDSKGYCSDVCWIEETDQVLTVEGGRVWSAIWGNLRDKKDMLIVCTMNKGLGVYKLLVDEFKGDDEVAFITLEKTDAPHIQAADNDRLIHKAMKVAAGEEYARMQLENVQSSEGELFNASAIAKAYNGYDEFMLDVGFIDATKRRTNRKPTRSVIGIDPGHGHPTGIFICSIHEGHIYEEESHMFVGKALNPRGREQKPGTTPVSEDYLKQFIAEKAREYNAAIVCESNSGGAWWMQQWKETSGVREVQPSNFGKEGTIADRSTFVKKLNRKLEEEQFHFCSSDLRSQLITYDPAQRDSADFEGKGDLADAALHACWYLINKEGAPKQTTWDGTS